jgi:hypothetical protein
MNPQSRFAVNTPNIVCEIFDNEVVAVNLDVGIYYSITGWSAKVWQMIQNGLSIEEMNQILTKYCDDSANINESLTKFSQNLLDKNLIVSSNSLDKTSSIEIQFENIDRIPDLLIEEFSDMQDILLLDPVHDVDESGWPSAKPSL